MDNIFSNNPFSSIALCITLFGFFALHRLALRRQKQANQTEAASKFIFTITTELSEIYPVCSKWPENIDAYLRNKFPVIQSAVEAYRPYVKDKTGFEKHGIIIGLAMMAGILISKSITNIWGFKSIMNQG